VATFDDVVVAYVAEDRDVFAEGVTVRQATSNLRASLRDEYAFFMRHRADLSQEFRGKLSLLQGMLG
jgi:flagellar motor protein MotB